jgi:tetratricopeptide (TPR) repeat protein
VINKAQHTIEKILDSYFSEEEISEYKKFLKRKPFKANLVSSLNNLNKNQLMGDTPSGSEFTYSSNLLITFAKDKLDKTKFVEFLIHLSNTSIIQGEFTFTIYTLKYLLNLVEGKAELISFQSHALYLLATVYSRLNDWKNSINCLKKAKPLFEAQKDFRGYVRCENLLGIINLDYGKLNNAQKNFENCLSFLNINNDSNLMGTIEINLGIINGMRGEYNESYNYFHRALIKFNRLKNIIRIIELRHNLGLLHTQKKEYKLALGEIDQSISLAGQLNYASNLVISYLAKAFILIKLNDLALASAFSDKSLELSYELNDQLSVADNFKIKGIIERERGNLKLAETHFLTSLRINNELNNRLNYAETSIELGILYKTKGDFESAGNYLKSALKYYKSIKHTEEITYLEELLKNLN